MISPAIFLQNQRLVEGVFWAIVPCFIVGLIIVFIVALFIIQHKQRQKRIRDLQAFAARNGWTFVPNAKRQMFENAHAYSLLSNSTGDVIALLHKPHDGGTVLIFDYAYTVGSGKNSTTHTQTVVAFQTPRLMIPYFALYPESFLSFIGEMFGFSDIDFHTHPVFSKNFKLTGREEMPIRRVFHPPALSFFERLPGIRVDGGGNYLFVYFLDETFETANLNNFLGTALSVYNLFRR